jgi:hypothetical protein
VTHPQPPTQPPLHPPPPALTALLLIVAVVMCLGAVFAGLLAARLVDLRADVAAARSDCACCDAPDTRARSQR